MGIGHHSSSPGLHLNGASRVTVDRDDDKCRFFSTHADDQVTLTMGPEIEPIAGGHWTNYPATAVKRLSTNFSEGGLLGVDMSIACDIPVASGTAIRRI
jgi:galactokinase